MLGTRLIHIDQDLSNPAISACEGSVLSTISGPSIRCSDIGGIGKSSLSMLCPLSRTGRHCGD